MTTLSVTVDVGILKCTYKIYDWYNIPKIFHMGHFTLLRGPSLAQV